MVVLAQAKGRARAFYESARAARKFLRSKNQEWGESLADIPREKWPQSGCVVVPFRVLRSRRFLVMLFAEKGGVVRLSAVRTEVGAGGSRFADGISWDELQDLKQQAGYGERFAVEIYPEDHLLVNVANMRHLWILEAPLDIGWRTSAPQQ